MTCEDSSYIEQFTPSSRTQNEDSIITDVKHPMETSNWISIFLISWLDSLMKRGAKKPLNEEDVWPLRQADRAAHLYQRFQTSWAKQTKPHFGSALLRSLAPEVLVSLFLFIIYSIPMLVQPVVIKSMLQYLQHDPASDTQLTTRIGITSGYGLAALLTILSIVSVTIIDFAQYLTTVIGCHAKSIVMEAVYQKSLRLSETAKNTMSSGEVVTLAAVDSERLFQGYKLCAWVISTPISLLAVYVMLGLEMGYLVGVTGGLTMFGMLYVGYVAAKAVGRARCELLGVQAERVKFTNEVLQGVRVVKFHGWEAHVESRIADIRSRELVLLRKYQIRSLFNAVALLVAPVLSLTVCILVYIAQGDTLTPTIAFSALAYMNVARLPCMVFSNSILAVQEAKASCDRINKFLQAEEATIAYTPGQPTIELKEASFSWCDTTTLHGMNLCIQPNTLTIVVGSVGSGKSSLIHAILGELPLVSGYRKVQGTFSYTSQEAWIQQDTLRNNILFHQQYDEHKYINTLRVCELFDDVNRLADGDATEIGERGMNLSGGQRARINLARAIYRTEADIYLLDDPLSALDMNVASAVFQKCVLGELKNKTTVLALNSHYHLLRHADRILVLADGAIVGDGTYEQVQVQFPHLQCVEQPAPVVNEVIALLQTGRPQQPVTKTCKLIAKEEQKTGAVSSATYVTYLSSSGWNSYVAIALVGFWFTSAQSALALTDWFMGHWATSPTSSSSPYIYLSLAIASILLVYGRSALILLLGVDCSKSIHQKIFHKVLYAPVNTFFDVTPIGRILNRFSSDLDQVDGQLPFLGIITLQSLFQVGSVILVCMISSPYILMLFVLLVGVFYQIQVFYNKTSNELKRLDSTTRSPVLNLINETFHGLATIRVFQTTQAFSVKHTQVLDHNQSFFLTYRVASRWMQMRLDWISSLIIAGVAFLTVLTKDSIGVVAAGLALTYASQLSSTLSNLTSTYANVETIMTSVERLDDFNALPTEGGSFEPSSTPPSSWPMQGMIQFENFSMRYRPDLGYALKHVSFTIQSGEKVGICGRTGSGKSSLMMALFRMVEGCGGRIRIDGIDISTIDVQLMRSRLTIIPQDPVLFSGSVRFNIDPSNEASDDMIWQVLTQVHLADMIRGFGNGLEYVIAEKGSNFSIGQRQLFCIARALLRKSRVVLLDEATANIDLESDRLIQQTIKEGFGDVTLLVIAHRLDTIIDSDRIILMSNGEVQETGSPSDLLSDETSGFAQLAKHIQSQYEHTKMP